MKKISGIMILGFCAAAAFSDTPDFSRYEVILDRKPFGVAPPAEETAPVITAENSFAKTIRMCALLEDDNGIRIGLIDQSNNKNFFLSIGQTEEGVELVSASYEDEEAVIRKGAEMAVIKLQSGEIQPLTPAEQQARLNAPQGRRPLRPPARGHGFPRSRSDEKAINAGTYNRESRACAPFRPS